MSSAIERRTFLTGVASSVAAVAAHPLAAFAAPAQAPATAGVSPGRAFLRANVVCGGPANDHDFDFARRRVLDALYEAGGIRTEVWPDYSNTTAIEAGDLLVSYTSLVPADAAQSQAIRRFVEKGGRWLAMHASNYVRDGDQTPDVLGSRFITHPAYGKFTVTITKPADPLVSGIAPAPSFEVEDELYVMEVARDIDVLLQARWGGKGIIGPIIAEADQPLMYRRRVGMGGVLYIALGHSSRQLDPPRGGAAPQPDRHGSWDSPVHKELFRRAMTWVSGRSPL